MSGWIDEHRAVWARKPALRAIYRHWIEALRRESVPGGPLIEVGCGPGFMKELWPEVLATDVVASPYAERVVDAAALPFADGEVATIVLLDVFHHLPAPHRFLREVARTLRGGGRLLLVEPWLGLAGRVFYRWIHHEGCDPRVDPEAPWTAAGKDPMDGNAALPWLYFRPGGWLERSGLPLRILRRERIAALPWLLTGGFQPVSLLPAALVPAALRVDRALSLVPALTATRCFLVVERMPPV
ncbi:MAG: class I SAM-dependent methyltransferase [Candidatus Binatia bacterium]